MSLSLKNVLNNVMRIAELMRMRAAVLTRETCADDLCPNDPTKLRDSGAFHLLRHALSTARSRLSADFRIGVAKNLADIRQAGRISL
jgi:hypothetical protein